MDLNILVRGQSNAQIMMDADGAAGQRALVDRVQQLLGFDGTQDRVQLIYGHPSDDMATVASGTALLTDWLNPVGGDWHNGWAIGTREAALLRFIQSQSAPVRDNPTIVLWLHNEYDAIRSDITEAMWSSAVRTDAALVRQALGQGAGTVPYLFVSAIPSSSANDQSLQVIRLGMEGLAGDASFNARIGARALDLDMSWDNLDGNPATPEYGGTHMSAGDALLVAERAARSIAEAWSAYALPGSPVARAGGDIANEGPKVEAARVVGEAMLEVDFGFDIASVLVARPVVGTGLGWSVRDAAGHSIASVGIAPVDADTVRIGFASALPEGPVRLHYGWGYGRLAAEDGAAQGNGLYDEQGLPAWTMAQGVGLLRWNGHHTVLDYSDTALRPTATHGLSLSMMARTDEVHFLDGRMVFAADDPAAVVLRLYHVALGREPEAEGLNHWIDALSAGIPLETITRSFLGSDEFRSRYASLTDADFVARLYREGLGREADPDGHAHWIDLLGGGQDRAQVVLSFSESQENRDRLAPRLAKGIWDADEGAAQIARLYDTAFGSRPDVEGFAHQLNALKAGLSLGEIASNFTQATGFASRYGAPGDADFVSALYHNALHREADPEGMAFWLSMTGKGMSRSDMMLAFSESLEHVAATSALTMGTHAGDAGIVFA